MAPTGNPKSYVEWEISCPGNGSRRHPFHYPDPELSRDGRRSAEEIRCGGDVGARRCAVEKLDQVSRLAVLCKQLEERLEYPRPAEPPEPLPYAVPFAKLAGECTPRYA